VEKDFALLNHMIKEIRTSSEIACALFCSRDPKCESFNFKCIADDSKIVNTTALPNCQLNAAKHVKQPNDFFPKKGYCYFQREDGYVTQKKSRRKTKGF